VSGSPLPRIVPIGERAMLVTLGDRIDLAVNARARRLAAAFEASHEHDPRFGRAIPAATSVLVPFDPLAFDPGEASQIVAGLVHAAVAEPTAEIDEADASRPPVEIQVSYGGSDGPDLATVAEVHGLRPDDIVELHAGSIWTAMFVGFAPGFAYLGPLPPELATARRSTPRERVAAGSVAIGGDQTGVYPFSMPGGWQVIGQTSVAMWDLGRARPNLIGPGDRVRFVPLR
jgi:KipI family sensor histidine kinase inhibitor